MLRALSLVMAAATACLMGCAGITAGPVSDDAKDDGFRYYDTSPFLLIYTDSKGGLKSEVLFLPDTAKIRSIRPYAYGASNKTTLKFENGRLVQATSEIDETVIPKAVIAGLEKVATLAAKAANSGNEGIPGPYLFRIVRKETGEWALSGAIAVGTDGKTPSVIKYTQP